MSKTKIVTQIHGIIHQLIKEKTTTPAMLDAGKPVAKDVSYRIDRTIEALRLAVSRYEGKEIE